MNNKKCKNCKWSDNFVSIPLYGYRDGNPYAPQCTGIICRYCPLMATRHLDDWCYKFEQKDKQVD